MTSYGISQKIVKMVQILYEDNESTKLDEGKESEWFKVKTGVKQGDVMSGFIFLMVVDWVMERKLKEAAPVLDGNLQTGRLIFCR